MAAVSLFHSCSMAAVTACEKTILPTLVVKDAPLLTPSDPSGYGKLALTFLLEGSSARVRRHGDLRRLKMMMLMNVNVVR